MLDIVLEDSHYVSGCPADLVLRLTNTGAGLLMNITLRLVLPAELLLLGDDEIELARLPAGATARHTVSIKPRAPGRWAITSPSCSYRDALGNAYRINNLRLPIEVMPPAPQPTPPAPSQPLRSPADTARLRRQLENNQRTLLSLEQHKGILDDQKAKFGGAFVPAWVLIQLREVEQEIARVEAEVERLRRELGE